ncbi:BZ3500_MvSof-1268-A1-R1_Chr3-1g05680 [Microbotryum saponariae]|uniref:BZ3500_MvSof-1268-A1-R1_Chr3-1g05680 protein n=1 Tax=Microbotryum saponariae TaxID=289078 RepID=A0A2X0KXC1_9BASI|nr:BZ3500_MvSof-1268-A1-R1_Chr3-1g05680 [Microbotryum saponariae]SDA04870.1 BZ3501_MvSof-1269-A2-R1_Chr3-1g05350 [Microbotryum saponariae]
MSAGAAFFALLLIQLVAVSAAPMPAPQTPQCSPSQYYSKAFKLCFECSTKLTNATSCNRNRPTACSYGRVSNGQCRARIGCSGPRYVTADGTDPSPFTLPSTRTRCFDLVTGASCRRCPDTNAARCDQSSGKSVACNYGVPMKGVCTAVSCTGDLYLAPSGSFCSSSSRSPNLLRTDHPASTFQVANADAAAALTDTHLPAILMGHCADHWRRSHDYNHERCWHSHHYLRRAYRYNYPFSWSPDCEYYAFARSAHRNYDSFAWAAHRDYHPIARFADCHYDPLPWSPDCHDHSLSWSPDRHYYPVAWPPNRHYKSFSRLADRDHHSFPRASNCDDYSLSWSSHCYDYPFPWSPDCDYYPFAGSTNRNHHTRVGYHATPAIVTTTPAIVTTTPMLVIMTTTPALP